MLRSLCKLFYYFIKMNRPYLTVRMETVIFVSNGVFCSASVSRSDADLSVGLFFSSTRTQENTGTYKPRNSGFAFLCVSLGFLQHLNAWFNLQYCILTWNALECCCGIPYSVPRLCINGYWLLGATNT